ncbi:MAG: hypothetical protein AAGG51_03685 [Cyanobacteria bacterium P01_G01_bin.54]
MSLTVERMPRLDLAPKLKRPLSLWNPLDYARLLYWIFYFPQAFRWYVETFGTEYIPRGKGGFRKGIRLLRTDAVQRNLWLQGLILSLIVSLAVRSVFAYFGLALNWNIMGTVLVISCLLNLFIGCFGSISEGLILCVGLSLFWGILAFLFREENNLLFRLFGAVGAGIVFSAFESVAGGILFSLQTLSYYICFHFMLPVLFLGPVALISLCIALIQLMTGDFELLKFIDDLYWLINAVFDSGWGVALLALFCGLRPDVWLLGTICRPYKSLWFPHSTFLPLPSLKIQLHNRLRLNWNDGLRQCQEVLDYSGQLIPVINAVNLALAESEASHLIWRVSCLTHHASDWRWVGLASVSLQDQIVATTKQYLRAMFLSWWVNKETIKRLIAQPITEPLRLDTPARATAAGFWCLHEKDTVQAVQAFNVVRHLPYGEEMSAIARSLQICQEAKTFPQIQTVQLSPCPEPDPDKRLRPAVWAAIASLNTISQEARLNQPDVSENTCAQAIARAQLELKHLLERAEQLPEAERGLMVAIATTWQGCFDTASRELAVFISYQ